LNSEMIRLQETARGKENAVESSVAKVRQIESEIEKQREALSEANVGFNDKQSEYYQVGSDIAQFEQQLQHVKEKIANTEAELEKSKASLADADRQHHQDKQEYEKLLSELQQLEPKLQGSRSESNRAYEILNQAEEAMQSWQTEWDKFNDSFTEFSRRQQADQSRLEFLENRTEEVKERRHQAQTDIDNYQQDMYDSRVDELRNKLSHLESQQSTANETYLSIQSSVKEKRERLKEISSNLDKARHQYQVLTGQLSSLETLQKSIVADNQELDVWLKNNGLSEFKRLSQLLKIEEKWAHALETVTSGMLGHLCVDNIEQHMDKLESIPGKVGFINLSSAISASDLDEKYTTLADLISSEIKLSFLLSRIVLAGDYEEAKTILNDMPDGYSVITPQGIWLGKDWLVVNHSEQAKDTVLSREQEIERVRQAIANAQKETRKLEQALTETEQAMESAEETLQQQQQSLNINQQQLSEIKTELASLDVQRQQNQKRHEELVEELDRLNEQVRQDEQEIDSIRSRLSDFDRDNDQLLSQKCELSTVKEKHKNSLNEARQRWQSTHEESHGIALQLESFSSRRASYEQAIKRNEIQVHHQSNRILELENELTQNKAPLAELQLKIEEALKRKLEAEKNLANARSTVHGIEAQLRELEQGRHQQEQGLEVLRSELEKARINVNGCQVRLETVIEKLNAFEQTAEALLEQLEESAQPADWQEKLDNIGRKIQRLGAINLAAIDEYKQSEERKTYLDSQHHDLTDALATLESAIRKIDKETRTRFKETFDHLNTNIKDMFPKLFGGGHAYLELTGDDLLQTGVAIMARPPGKKNSNIHLLSGGEKALTAVALVFAIFKLNPAPFCILDEVDAPLDDTNTGRFSQLVKSMSDEVQFIFITHNKITMEIANQLMGVTMHEPGVSRLVSVDVDEAVEMAKTA